MITDDGKVEVYKDELVEILLPLMHIEKATMEADRLMRLPQAERNKAITEYMLALLGTVRYINKELIEKRRPMRTVWSSEDELLTLEQTCKLLSITTRTLQNKIKSGDMPFPKTVAGRKYYTRRMLVEILCA